MGIPESDLPIAKAEAAVKALAASNPPGVKHNADGTTSEITQELKTEVTPSEVDDFNHQAATVPDEEEKKSASAQESSNKSGANKKKQVPQTA